MGELSSFAMQLGHTIEGFADDREAVRQLDQQSNLVSHNGAFQLEAAASGQRLTNLGSSVTDADLENERSKLEGLANASKEFLVEGADERFAQKASDHFDLRLGIESLGLQSIRTKGAINHRLETHINFQRDAVSEAAANPARLEGIFADIDSAAIELGEPLTTPDGNRVQIADPAFVRKGSEATKGYATESAFYALISNGGKGSTQASINAATELLDKFGPRITSLTNGDRKLGGMRGDITRAQAKADKDRAEATIGQRAEARASLQSKVKDDGMGVSDMRRSLEVLAELELPLTVYTQNSLMEKAKLNDETRAALDSHMAQETPFFATTETRARANRLTKFEVRDAGNEAYANTFRETSDPTKATIAAVVASTQKAQSYPDGFVPDGAINHIIGLMQSPEVLGNVDPLELEVLADEVLKLAIKDTRSKIDPRLDDVLYMIRDGHTAKEIEAHYDLTQSADARRVERNLERMSGDDFPLMMRDALVHATDRYAPLTLGRTQYGGGRGFQLPNIPLLDGKTFRIGVDAAFTPGMRDDVRHITDTLVREGLPLAAALAKATDRVVYKSQTRWDLIIQGGTPTFIHDSPISEDIAEGAMNAITFDALISSNVFTTGILRAAVAEEELDLSNLPLARAIDELSIGPNKLKEAVFSLQGNVTGPIDEERRAEDLRNYVPQRVGAENRWILVYSSSHSRAGEIVHPIDPATGMELIDEEISPDYYRYQGMNTPDDLWEMFPDDGWHDVKFQDWQGRTQDSPERIAKEKEEYDQAVDEFLNGNTTR